MTSNPKTGKKKPIDSTIIVALIGATAVIISALIGFSVESKKSKLELTQIAIDALQTEISSTQLAFFATQTLFDASRQEVDSAQSALRLTLTPFQESQQDIAAIQTSIDSTRVSLETSSAALSMTQAALAPTGTPTATPTATSIDNSIFELCRKEVSLGWEFDKNGNTEGWRNGRRLFDTTARDGKLTATISAFDPYWIYPAGLTTFDAALYRILEIRYRIIDASDVLAQFMWTTTSTSGNQWIEFRITTDGEWHIAVVDLPTETNWVDKITSLRFDPVKDALSGRVEVDYIRFCSP